MTRRLVVIDRLVTLVVGLALVAGGLALLDWRFELVRSWPQEIELGRYSELSGQSWWWWSVGGAGVVLGLLAVLWLLAHVPRPHRAPVRTENRTELGSVKIDVESLARTAGRRFQSLAPVIEASGASRRLRRQDVVELKARIDLRSDGPLILEAARQTRDDVEATLPGRQVACRVLLSGPRRVRRPRSGGPARVH